MRLLKRRKKDLVSSLKHATHWQFAAALIIISVAVAAFGDEGRDLLKYDRLAIEGGEYWRFISAHFAHLGIAHLLLNMIGLVLTWLLVGRNYSVPEWLLVFVISLASQAVGFWVLDKNMLWYVGMSGLLHGLMLAGALRGLKSLPVESAMLCALVTGKLIYEQASGPLPGSESASGGSVMVNAHFYGAIGGVLAAGILWRRDARTGSI